MSTQAEHPLTRALRATHEAVENGNLLEAERLLSSLTKSAAPTEAVEALEAWVMVRAEEVATVQAQQTPDSSHGWRQLSHSRWAVRREVERRRAIEDGLRNATDTLDLYHHLVDVHHAVRHYEGALAHAEEGLLAHKGDPYLVERRAHCMVAVGHPDAITGILEHTKIAPGDWLNSWEMMLQAGAFEHAESLLDTAIQDCPTDPVRRSAAGRMQLWCGESGRARATGLEVIELAPNRPEGHFLVGAADSLDGDPKAHVHLQRAIDAPSPDDSWFEVSAALLFMAQHSLAGLDRLGAIDLAQQARSRSFRFNGTSLLIRSQATAVHNPTFHTPSNRHCLALDQFQSIMGDGPGDWRENAPAFNAMTRLVIGKLAGNRSSIPTWFDGSKLRPIRLSPVSAERARKAQLCIRLLEPETVKAQFEQLYERFPESPTCYTYHGELLLWLGEYEASIELFRRAIGRHHMTIWAWIGWAAALALIGDDEGSLTKLAEGIEAANFEGPTVFVYRGEIYRRQRRFAEAKKDLNIAVASKPERISAWINRVLLDHAMGDDATCKVLGRAIRRTNPGAWWDASAHADTEPLSLNHTPKVLEALLDLMQGNRSSAIPTIVVRGCLRTIRWRVEDIPDQLKSLGS